MIDGYKVVATLDDYAMARRFLANVIGEAAGAAVPPSVVETFNAILACAERLSTDPARPHWPSLGELSAQLGGIDKAAVSRRVARAKELGLVVDQRRPGFPSRLALVQALPTSTDVLPSVEQVKTEIEDAAANTEAPTGNGDDLRAGRNLL